MATEPPSPVIPEQEKTILGIKATRLSNDKREEKFLKACQREANIIITSVLIGYMQWRAGLQQAVEVKPDDEDKDKDKSKAIDKLNTLITQSDEDKPPPQDYSLSDDAIKKLLSKSVYAGKGASLGVLRMQDGGEVLQAYGARRVFVTDAVRWNPKVFKAKEKKRPWGLADNLEPLPKGMDVLPKQKKCPHQLQVIGYVHGACLCFHARELEVEINSLDIYEYSLGKDKPKEATCLPCAVYMSAMGYHTASIHLGPARSWIAPGKIEIAATTEEVADSLLFPSIFQQQLFNSFMQAWLKAGLQTLKKRKLGAKGKSFGGAKIIPRLAEQSDSAADLFVDALTMPLSIGDCVAKILAK